MIGLVRMFNIVIGKHQFCNMTVLTKHGSSAHSHTLQLVLGSFLWPKGQWFSHQGISQEAVEIKIPLEVWWPNKESPYK